MVRAEERIAAEKAAERVSKRIFQDEPMAEREPVGREAKQEPIKRAANSEKAAAPKRRWWRVVLGVVGLIFVGYLSIVGVSSYQQNQRNIAATATQEMRAALATATAESLQVLATATAPAISAIAISVNLTCIAHPQMRWPL